MTESDKNVVHFTDVMIGGNHLANIIGPDHPPYSASNEDAFDFYGSSVKYDAWVAWAAIMRLRDRIARTAADGPYPAPKGLIDD